MTTAPAASLLAPVTGPARYVPWVILSLLVQTDALTGVRNRRATITAATRLLGEAQQQTQPLAVLMVDVDHFKNVNDTYGHAAGPGGGDVAVTVSVGSASSLTSGPDAMLAAADRALYVAKHDGRNRVRRADC